MIPKITTLFLMILLITLSACGPTQSESLLNKPFTIGIIAPLTGPNAWMGPTLVTPAEMAVDEINALGGINGLQMKLIIEDGDNAQKATTSANKLISQDNVNILYPIGTPVVAGASAVAEQNQVPLFGFTAVASFAKKNTWVFSDLRDVKQECRMLGAKALENHQNRIAFFGNDADFSLECLEIFKSEFVTKGGVIVANEMKVSNDPDAKTILEKIKHANPDAMVLICLPPDCNLIYKQMLELNVTPQLYLPIGIPLAANPLAVKGIDKNVIFKNAYSADQAVDPQNPTPAFAEFIQKYKAKLGKEPEHLVDPAVVYDNIHEIAVAATYCQKKGEITNTCLRDALSNTNYTGILGTIAFKGNHYAARSARLLQYQNGSWVGA